MLCICYTLYSKVFSTSQGGYHASTRKSHHEHRVYSDNRPAHRHRRPTARHLASATCQTRRGDSTESPLFYLYIVCYTYFRANALRIQQLYVRKDRGDIMLEEIIGDPSWIEDKDPRYGIGGGSSNIGPGSGDIKSGI